MLSRPSAGSIQTANTAVLAWTTGPLLVRYWCDKNGSIYYFNIGKVRFASVCLVTSQRYDTGNPLLVLAQ